MIKSPDDGFDWEIYLHKLRHNYHIKIDSTLLKDIEFTSLPFLAVRPGQYASLVVPVWPMFEIFSDENGD